MLIPGGETVIAELVTSSFREELEGGKIRKRYREREREREREKEKPMFETEYSSQAYDCARKCKKILFSTTCRMYASISII